MVSEIKNIILDWGGIIIGLDENDCIEAFKKIGAPEVAQAIADGRKNPVFSDFESGRCDTILMRHIGFPKYIVGTW